MFVLDEGCRMQPCKAVHWIALSAVSGWSHKDVDILTTLRRYATQKEHYTGDGYKQRHEIIDVKTSERKTDCRNEGKGLVREVGLDVVCNQANIRNKSCLSRGMDSSADFEDDRCQHGLLVSHSAVWMLDCTWTERWTALLTDTQNLSVFKTYEHLRVSCQWERERENK